MVYQNNPRTLVQLGKSQQLQLVCRNEKAESEKVLGECRAHVTLWSEQAKLLWQLDRITQISLPLSHQRPLPTHVLSWQVGPVQPGKHSQLPSPRSPSLQIPLSQAHSAGQIQTPLSVQPGLTSSRAAISLPALLLIQHIQLPSRKCHRSVKRKQHRSISSLFLTARPKRPGRDHLPLLAVVWVAAGRAAQHMFGLRMQNGATPVPGHKYSLLLSLSWRPGSHLPVSESWDLFSLPPPS